MLRRYDQLPTDCPKTLVVRCTREAGQAFRIGSAAVCSVGYGALLRYGFGGGFRALVAWWQASGRTQGGLQ